MNQKTDTNQSNKADQSGTAWHHLSIQAVTDRLGVDPDVGLDDDGVESARQQHGPNELTETSSTGWIGHLFKQFQNPLVLILLVAGIITLIIGHLLDTAIIMAALAVNVIIGAFQEERASKAFEALEESQSKQATVIRGGRKQVIPAEEVVVGDVVVLDAGMDVPADMRILTESNLEMNEAALTGEWMTVEKDTDPCGKDTVVPDRTSMAWKGTLVASGTGKGVVIAVGDKTEVGRIAQSLSVGTDTQTPIQKHIQRLARFLAVVSVLAVAVIFVLGLVRGEPLLEMVAFSLAVAVSVVPEGLPAAVTVVLALGMKRLLDRGGLVRNLRAAETLGSTTTILTDKTGTLTQAKMAVDELFVYTPQAKSDVSGSQREDGQSLSDTQKRLLEFGIANTEAFVEGADEDTTVRGEPIEKALVSRGLEAGIDKSSLQNSRQDFIAFSSKNRFSISLQTDKESAAKNMVVSGAPEVVLEKSTKVATESGQKKLDEAVRKNIRKALSERSAAGKRVIAIGYKSTDAADIPREDEGTPQDSAVSDLVFMGLISVVDPVREDVAAAIEQAKGAGVHVVMVTGDNPETADYIAQKAGIKHTGAQPVTGSELDDMSDEAVVEALRTRNVFARILPHQKLRIAKLLQDREEVVAMTGDGVNDAPALRMADIGVAVGSGTEVAKEASDLILLDDSFSIIVSAIEEGRRIIDNLKKIIANLLSASFGELFLIGGALVVGLPTPILIAQILWINIIEGGLLTFVFAAEPPAPDIMKRAPTTDRMKHLINKPLKWLIFASGTITGIAAFIIYMVLHQQGLPLDSMRTLMFVVLTIDALFFTLALKNFYQPIYNIDFTNNRFLIISLGLSLIALFGAIYIGPLREVLSLTIPTANQWLFLIGVGIFDLLVVEICKYWLFQRSAE